MMPLAIQEAGNLVNSTIRSLCCKLFAINGIHLSPGSTCQASSWGSCPFVLMPEFIYVATNKTNHEAKSYHQGRKDNLGHMNFPEKYLEGNPSLPPLAAKVL